jgi:hypothetical protein
VETSEIDECNPISWRSWLTAESIRSGRDGAPKNHVYEQLHESLAGGRLGTALEIATKHAELAG